MIDSKEEAAEYLFWFCKGDYRGKRSSQHKKLFKIRRTLEIEIGQPYKKKCGAATRKVYNNSGDRVPCSRTTPVKKLHCHHHTGSEIHPPHAWELKDG